MNHGSSRQFSSGGGNLSVEVFSPQILTTTLSGCLDVAAAQHLLACLEGWVKLGGSALLAFHDWETVTDYEERARELLTPWSKANRSKFERVHILVSGRTLAWGIQLMNALVGDLMTAHHSRAVFEARSRAARCGRPAPMDAR
ncbi:MAG: hypothetical protein ABI461_08845 [Polyangiaceae bacterium]